MQINAAYRVSASKVPEHCVNCRHGSPQPSREQGSSPCETRVRAAGDSFLQSSHYTWGRTEML